MEIPKGMENKLDDKKKEILSKIDLDKVTSPYARLLLKFLSYGVTFEQAVNIKTPMVLAQAYPWCKPLEDYIVNYVSNDIGRIEPEYFLGYKPLRGQKSTAVCEVMCKGAANCVDSAGDYIANVAIFG